MNPLKLPLLRSLVIALAFAPRFAFAADLVPTSAPAAAPALISPILHDLRAFRELGSVLHIAAHPDDENTQLITYLARGRGYRTAYLSLTRGDGGQNESGPEFGEKLGLARTLELLAARQLDGGHQYFTRALDFGFSKDLKETLSIWDRQLVLADVVRVIRSFRPDVVITRFYLFPALPMVTTPLRACSPWRLSSWPATPMPFPNNSARQGVVLFHGNPSVSCITTHRLPPA